MTVETTTEATGPAPTGPNPPRRESIGRCRACGERLYAGDDVMRVSEGQLHETGDLEDFDEESGVWGYMHKPCFLLAIRDPDAIMHLG